MFKKLLATTVLGASALGTLGAASAATAGLYVTGQLGYADTHMGPRTSVLTDYKGSSVPGAAGGFDVQIGKSPNDKTNNGVAGRVAVGYQFSPYFASELGFLKTRTERVQGRLSNYGRKDGPGEFTLNQNALDLVAKGILPLANRFNAYAKAGVAYITTCADMNVAGGSFSTWASPAFVMPLNPAINTAKRQWAPEAAVGVSYDLASNVPVDLSWTHIHPFGKRAPGNIDFISFGLGYNFG